MHHPQQPSRASRRPFLSASRTAPCRRLPASPCGWLRYRGPRLGRRLSPAWSWRHLCWWAARPGTLSTWPELHLLHGAGSHVLAAFAHDPRPLVETVVESAHAFHGARGPVAPEPEHDVGLAHDGITAPEHID